LLAEKTKSKKQVFRFMNRTYVYLDDGRQEEVLSSDGSFTLAVHDKIMGVRDALFLLLAHNNVFQLHESFLNENLGVRATGLRTYSTPIAYYQSVLVKSALHYFTPPYSSLFIREFLVPAVRWVVEGYRKLASTGHEKELSALARPRYGEASSVSLLLGLIGRDIISVDTGAELLARSLENSDTRRLSGFILSKNRLEKIDPAYMYFSGLGKYSPFFDRVKDRVSMDELHFPGRVPQLVFEVSFRAFDSPEDLGRLLTRYWRVPVTARRKRGGGYHLAVGRGRSSILFYLSEKSMFEAGKSVRHESKKRVITLGEALMPSGLVSQVLSDLAVEIYERLEPVPPTRQAGPGVYVLPGWRAVSVLAPANGTVMMEKVTSAGRLVELVEEQVIVSPLRAEEIINRIGENFYGGRLAFTLAKKTGIISLADARLLGRTGGRTYYSARVARRRWALIEDDGEYVSVVDVANDPSVFRRAYETVKAETDNRWADLERAIERAGGRIIQKGAGRFTLRSVPGEIIATTYDVESSGWTVSVLAFESDVRVEDLAKNVSPVGGDCRFTSRLAQVLRADGWDARMNGCVLVAGRGRRRLLTLS